MSKFYAPFRNLSYKVPYLLGEICNLFHAKWDKTVKKVGQQGYDVKNSDCPSYIGLLTPLQNPTVYFFFTYLESQGQSLDFHCLAYY